MNSIISPEIKSATEKYLKLDEDAKKIDDLSKEIQSKELSLAQLKADLSVIKATRPQVVIKWRDSIKWCLEIDAKNPKYFLKTAAGVYKCISFKHKIDITPDIKNKIATTLSLMFRDQLVGRLTVEGVHLYGLKDFFENDFKTLKKEYEKDIEDLIIL